jgi:NAD(P)-dependent dehydrogenase (short-subunit alcohol dehydrogenase family)
VRYQDKVVIVTGGTKGIGEGCVRVFVEAGAKVVFCARDEAAGQKLAHGVTAGGPGEAVFIRCDVSRAEQVERLVDATVERYGRLDCLVNNAGWHPPHKPIDAFTPAEFRELFELNVMSVFVACRRALPHLRRTRGSIINISSLVATIGQLHATTYVATKGAITAFTKALAVDEAAHGVRVNSVSPGNIYTPLWQEAIDASADPAQTRADGEAAQPLGRMGTGEETGRLCLFLAAEATFTTGVDHIQSGGAELGYGRKTRISSKP